MFNNLLERQLKKCGVDVGAHADMLDFLQLISDTYSQFEADQRHLHRTLALSSEETTELNRRLRNEGDRLRSLNQRLCEIQDMAGICSFDWTVNIDEFHFSNGFSCVSGKSGSQKYKLNDLLAFIVASDRRKVQLDFLRALRNFSSFETECGLVSSKGEMHHVHITAHFVFDAGRQLQEVVGAIQDITQRKSAELEIEKAHSNLQILFDNIGEVVYTVTFPNNHLIQMSKSCEEMYGFSQAEFFQNPNLWYDVIIDEDKHIIDNNQATLAAGNVIHQEYRIRHRDGGLRWIESKITPTMKDGVMVRLDGTNCDVTDRKLSEELIQVSERRFRKLIEKSKDAISILDEHGVIMYQSPSLLEQFGKQATQRVGQLGFDFIHPDDVENAKEVLQRVIADAESPVQFHLRHRHADGHYIWVEGIVTNLLNEESVNGLVANFRDITDRKLTEQHLIDQNNRLTKANAELDRFVYSVSHDLRAPLTSMLGLLQIIDLKLTDQFVKPQLKMLNGCIHKLDGFISDILDYSRNSRIESRTELIDFLALLSDISSNLKYMGDGNRVVTFITKVNGDVDAFSDKYRLSIILNNLISNAIRYQNPSIQKPFVEVKIDITEELIGIHVIDNGLGIDPKYHERIFDIFYRVSEQSVGSGLGLYILKECVDRLGGTVHLHSVQGEGSDFHILIPNKLQSTNLFITNTASNEKGNDH